MYIFDCSKFLYDRINQYGCRAMILFVVDPLCHYFMLGLAHGYSASQFKIIEIKVFFRNI